MNTEHWMGHVRWLTLVMAGVLGGCHGATVCEPPWSTSGQFVRLRNSQAYVEQMSRVEADVPHTACRAEATIPTQKLYLRESEPATYTAAPGMAVKSTTPYDVRVVTPRNVIGKFSGNYRVLGVGRGIDAEDCATAAIQACDDAIDAYWRKERAVRPIDIPCMVLADNERCPGPGGSFETPLAATEAPVAPRFEAPLVTLIKKLDDVRTRRDAVRGLVQFFDNAKARADGDVANPAVKALLDKIVEPLAQTYAESDLDDMTRVELIRALGEAQDPRAGRAYTRAFAAFIADIEGGPKAAPSNTKERSEDVFWGAYGVAGSRYQESAPALADVFAKFEAGTNEGAKTGKMVKRAMIALKNPTWTSMLIDKIGRPIEGPASTDSASYRSQVWWQTTAAEVLGEIRDPAATKPLTKILIDAKKKAVHPTALLAIVGIGKDAVPILADILAGKDAELALFARARASDNDGEAKSYVRVAAKALGALGRPEVKDALIRALRSNDSPTNSAAIARALAQLPASAEVEKAFELAYDKATPDQRAELLGAASGFGDPEFVPWVLARVKGARESYARQEGLRTAILLMKSAQVAAVKAVVEKVGTDADKAGISAASQLLDRCDRGLDCYLSRLAEPGGAEGKAVSSSVKAAYMLAILGDADTAMKIVSRLKDVKENDARLAALGAIDRLVRKDGAAVAVAVDKAIDEGAEDEVRMATRLVSYRLRAR
jgi:HEAT repeat protein